MRKFALTLAAAAAVLTSAALLSTGAQAAPAAGAPAAALDLVKMAQNVHNRCTYVRTGHGWRRFCSWRSHGDYRPYRYRAPYHKSFRHHDRRWR